MPSLNIVTTSMELAVVLNVAAPLGNLTAVDVSVPNVAVRRPVASCLMIKLTVPPVGKLVMTKPVLVANVTVCTGAKLQSTVMVELDVNALIASTYPELNFTTLFSTTCPVPCVVIVRSELEVLPVIVLV